MYLIDYLSKHNMRPYSLKAADWARDKLGIGRRYFGYIATGERRPSLELAHKIKEATDGEVTSDEIFEYYKRQQDNPPLAPPVASQTEEQLHG